MRRLNLANLAKIAVCLFLLIQAVQPPIDPDLGWHLRYGEYFFQTGQVLKDNLLSFVWPNYHWVQASWGFDLLVYQLFIHGGFLALAVTGALFTFLIFLIITWPLKRLSPLQLFFLSIIFLVLTSPLWGGALRTPTLSTVFLALTIVLSDSFLNPEERRLPRLSIWLLPVLFFFWANLHGGFALGLILLTSQWVSFGVLLALRKRKKITFSGVNTAFWRVYGFALFVSWLTPLINPWGLRLYTETFQHTTNTNLTVIAEWMPLVGLKTESIVTALLVALTLLVVALRREIRNLPAVMMLLLATYLAFSANRFLIILGVITTYLLSRNLPQLHWRRLQNRLVQIGIAVLLCGLVAFDMFVSKVYFPLPNPVIFRYNWSNYCDFTLFCSEGITQVMLSDLPGGPGFHPYSYGGYLSWRVPQVKTFIDGRMSAWVRDGKTPPLVEGDWVFMQKNPVAFLKFENEYHFRWAIVPTPSGVTGYLNELVKNQLWERRYRDELYSYYVKIK